MKRSDSEKNDYGASKRAKIKQQDAFKEDAAEIQALLQAQYDGDQPTSTPATSTSNGKESKSSMSITNSEAGTFMAVGNDVNNGNNTSILDGNIAEGNDSSSRYRGHARIANIIDNDLPQAPLNDVNGYLTRSLPSSDNEGDAGRTWLSAPAHGRSLRSRVGISFQATLPNVDNSG